MIIYKLQMIIDRVLHPEILKSLHKPSFAFRDGLLRIYDSKDHVWHLGQNKWSQAFDHKVEAINFLIFIVDVLSLHHNLRF